MNRIITISREFGSGGRTIGKEVAEKLGIPCYDSDLIHRIAEESGLSEAYIKNTEESYSSGIFASRTYGLTNEDKLWNAECRVILELAEKGPCVIVGRCADYILRDKADLLTVYIHASKEFRAHRIEYVYGENANKSAIQRVEEKDKRRSAYHRFYTDMKWGQAGNYDICLDSEKITIAACVEIIASLY